MTEQEAYVAFNLTEQIGSVTLKKLVDKAGSAVSAWSLYPKKVARSGGPVDWENEFKLAKKYAVNIVTPADEAYPARLKAVPGHPLALYVKGSVEAINKPSVAIVGTRRLSPYGKDQAFVFARDLASMGWSIISGLALGADAEAHKGALEAGGITVGVIGSGLDRFYPEENRELAREIVKKGGAVVSEFPFGRSPDQSTFPQRNHVVAALATGVVAIEAPLKSGTLITTSIAAELGRAVMALPGRVDSFASQGCLRLIRDGATLVRHAADVNEQLSDLFAASASRPKLVPGIGRVKSEEAAAKPNLPPNPPPEPSITLEESMILRELDREGVSIDALVMRTKLPVAKVNALVMELRLKGRVRFFPGGRVALPRAS